MEDEAILLKLKREFTTNEAVQSLLKIVSSLEMEIGVLKSELAEEQHKVKKLRTEKTQTKKQWLKDEIIKEMDHQLNVVKKQSNGYKKSMDDWRYKYFNLLAKQSSGSMVIGTSNSDSNIAGHT